MARDIDQKLRENITAWLRWHREQRRKSYPDDIDFAHKIGISHSHLSNILNNKRTLGLDVLVKIHRAMNWSIDQMVDDPPPTDAPPPESRSPRRAPRRRGRAEEQSH